MEVIRARELFGEREKAGELGGFFLLIEHLFKSRLLMQSWYGLELYHYFHITTVRVKY